jgi:hypothetical protein
MGLNLEQLLAPADLMPAGPLVPARPPVPAIQLVPADPPQPAWPQSHHFNWFPLSCRLAVFMSGFVSICMRPSGVPSATR